MSREIINRGQQRTDALAGKLTFEQGRNRIIGRDASNIPRLLILGNGSQFSMKVSSDGVNVITSGPSGLIFNSDDNLFKIVGTGTVVLASPNSAGTSTSANISHSLGYNPIVFAFASTTPLGTARPLPYNDVIVIGSDAGKVRYQVGFEAVSNDTITFFHRDITSGTSITNYIKYFIVQETANSNPPLGSLIDEFTGTSLDTDIWYAFGEIDYTVDGDLEFAVAANDTGARGIYTAEPSALEKRYSLVNSSMHIEVTNAGNQSLPVWNCIPISLQLDNIANNALRLVIKNDLLRAVSIVDGVYSELATIAYNASNQRWLRIRESGDTVYWEYSSDKNTWNELHSESTPFTATGLLVYILGFMDTIAASATTMNVDNINA